METGLADLVFTDYAQEVYCVSGRVLHPVIRARIEMKYRNRVHHGTPPHFEPLYTGLELAGMGGGPSKSG